MKTAFFSSKLRVGLMVAMAACLIPLTGFTEQTDSTYAYVSSVFDKLQSHWETQAYDTRLQANSLLTFTLSEDGTLLSTQLDGGQTGNDSSQNVVAFLKQNAPFAHFPSTLTGSQLEFKVKLAPGSLQMLGYQIVEKNVNNQVVSYAAPSAAQPVSLFYARALPVTPGKVWDKPEAQSEEDKNMAAYVNEVQEQIRKNWRLAEDYKFEQTVALVMIDRDGSLLSAQLKKSSGDKLVDKAALNAVMTAGPFPKVPANVQSLPVMIEYVFEPVLMPAE
jgi:TonB family protein